MCQLAFEYRSTAAKQISPGTVVSSPFHMAGPDTAQFDICRFGQIWSMATMVRFSERAPRVARSGSRAFQQRRLRPSLRNMWHGLAWTPLATPAIRYEPGTLPALFRPEHPSIPSEGRPDMHLARRWRSTSAWQISSRITQLVCSSSASTTGQKSTDYGLSQQVRTNPAGTLEADVQATLKLGFALHRRMTAKSPEQS